MCYVYLIYGDVFTCGENCNTEKAFVYFVSKLNVKKYKVKIIARGGDMERDRLPEKLKCVFVISFLQDFSYYVYLSVFALFLNRKTSLLNTSIIIAITNLVPVFAGFFSDKIERKIERYEREKI